MDYPRVIGPVTEKVFSGGGSSSKPLREVNRAHSAAQAYRVVDESSLAPKLDRFSGK
jgi:hypothetical protein